MLDIENLNINELQELIQQAETLIIRKQENQMMEAYKQFENIAKECNSTISEILEAGRELASKRSIRYANPENKEETWTGRGRKPLWLIAALEDGRKLSEFEV